MVLVSELSFFARDNILDCRSFYSAFESRIITFRTLNRQESQPDSGRRSWRQPEKRSRRQLSPLLMGSYSPAVRLAVRSLLLPLRQEAEVAGGHCRREAEQTMAVSEAGYGGAVATRRRAKKCESRMRFRLARRVSQCFLGFLPV